MEPRQLRDKANEALTKGRFSRAAELFEEYCQQDPKDYQARVRLGDAWVKVGNNARAITAYQAAAEGFAREGFLPRAIAASKLILELDPSHQGVQQMLAGLYARRGGAGGASRAITPAPTPVKQAVATEPPAPAPETRSALFIELPPEIDEALAEEPAAEASAPDGEAEAPASAPGIEVELDLEDAGDAPPTGPAADIEVELDLSDAEKGSGEAAPSQPTVAKAAPPGLRRRSSDARPPEPEKPEAPAPSVSEPAPQPLRVAAVQAPSSRVERFTPQDGVDFQPPVPGSTPFTELAVQADSLLHAVELAALAGAGAESQPEQEPVPSGHAADDQGSAGSEEPVSEAPSQDDGGLPKIPLFSDLPRDAFIALFERCPLRRFPEGALIIEQGTRGDAFYVICAGRVRIVRQSGAEQRNLAVLGEGAFFGEMALLSGAPRSASVVSASEETQLLEISAPVLAALSRRFPQVAKALRRFCRQRLLSDVVNTSALFQPFGRKDRRELVERFRAREVRRGDTIIHEGAQVDGLYVVLSGEVAVSKGGQSLAQLHEGELFGEMSLLQKTPATATVTAARNTSLLRLPREVFDTLILTHPQILALVSELTESRQRSNAALLGGQSEVERETVEPHEELLLF
ncbi:cyclic nucleotide-binding domain-containing protein [Vitiosangium sp. GDMCC 1.1324]|uniref:cyclic nucleotide-binding domain-containing protein n=1 Tax=Vitiosangium sp. (strain GDMCC 1.1324) TaxID=2138576 RepID=UPI000D3D672D|nr:cyclic nucleotide-binding domain-containing protein [Vitiosangium sp. GDMCC 1.1324]PTL85793.1 cyclic nucleotide-binding protein [Vitiosangium sp. GDMCC 1.1324]